MTTTVDIRFESPAPGLPLPAEDRDAFIDALRWRPGIWALMGQHRSAGAARQLAYCIRNSLRPWTHLAAGVFDAESKTVMGEHRVYVRYLGQRTPHVSSEVTGR